MSIPVTCAKCSASFRVKDEFAGRSGKCPHCRETLFVPSASAAGEDIAVVAKLVSPSPTPAPAKPTPGPSASTAGTAKPAAAARKPAQAVSPKAQTAAKAAVGEPAASQPVRPVSEAELLAAFRGDFEQVHPTWTYRLALVLVGAVMLLLPMIYLGVIGLVGYGMYLHAIYDVAVFNGIRGRGAILAVIFYLGVLFAGGVAILFMIKPFFARSADVDRRRSLTRDGEPLLFGFVDRICDAVGAPRPQRIDVDCQVNASASFRRGLWSMVIGGDMVLTIGLSLTAGMTIEQFAGVLAHEFGHFSQGLGMRMSCLIRVISFWFTRVVYDRDKWDQRLVEWTEQTDIRIGIVLWFARLLVWCSRRVLWVLMITGHAVAGYLLRQMEYDADRYETRLCGSADFEQCSRRLTMLSVAFQGALADLREFHREGRLGDNLPRLVVVNAKQMPAEVRQAVDKMVEESKTGVFDTHPSDKDRIISARRENAAGVFHDPRPATALFTNFDNLARNATWDFYRGIFGAGFKPTDMHSIDDLLARQERDAEDKKALDRVFQGAFNALRILTLPEVIPEPEDINAKAVAAELKQSRATLLEDRDAFKEKLKLYTTYDTQLREVGIAQSLRAAGIPTQAKTFSVPLTNKTETDSVGTKAFYGQQSLAKQMETFEATVSRRIFTALTLLGVPQVAKRIDGAQARLTEGERLLPVLALLRRWLDKILQIRNHHMALELLVGQIEKTADKQFLFKTIYEKMESEIADIYMLSERLADFRYPLDHAKGHITVAQYALANLPPRGDLGAILSAGPEMLDNLAALYGRMMRRLAATVEAVETVLGLPQLPAPIEEATTATRLANSSI